MVMVGIIGGFGLDDPAQGDTFRSNPLLGQRPSILTFFSKGSIDS